LGAHPAAGWDGLWLKDGGGSQLACEGSGNVSNSGNLQISAWWRRVA